MELIDKPQELQLTPDAILVISKQNARTFHEKVKERIKENGYGLLEYVETIKFFEKLQEVISGSKDVPGDGEFKSMIRDEIQKYGKETISKRGVKFELAETGAKYDFGKCEDPELSALEDAAAEATEALKARKEFLKTVPIKGLDIVDEETGEVSKIYPPSKSSTSGYKITLPK